MPADDLEVRRLSVTNEDDRRRMLTLTTYGEVVLGHPRDDERHPAFSKLFVNSEWRPAARGLLFARRPRHPNERPPVLLHAVILDPSPPVEVTGYETDRRAFLGRHGNPRRPRSVVEELTGVVGWTLDPIFAMQVRVMLDPGQRAELCFVTAAAGSRESVLQLAERYDRNDRSGHLLEYVFQRDDPNRCALTTDDDPHVTSARLQKAQDAQQSVFRADGHCGPHERTPVLLPGREKRQELLRVQDAAHLVKGWFVPCSRYWASGRRPRRQRRLTDRERDGSSRSNSFWAHMYPQTQNGASDGKACPDSGDRGAGRPQAALEAIMLLRELQEPLATISKETRLAEESLFLHLEELARNRPFLLDCTGQQLTDSGAEVCAWSGAADGVVVEFETWLDKKYPRPALCHGLETVGRAEYFTNAANDSAVWQGIRSSGSLHAGTKRSAVVWRISCFLVAHRGNAPGYGFDEPGVWRKVGSERFQRRNHKPVNADRHSRDDVPRLSCTGTVGPLRARTSCLRTPTSNRGELPRSAHPDSRDAGMVEQRTRSFRTFSRIQLPSSWLTLWAIVRASHHGVEPISTRTCGCRRRHPRLWLHRARRKRARSSRAVAAALAPAVSASH